jgi:hypothetical protein
MKFQTKYKLVLLKTYFDNGYGITSYFKYGIALFGLSTLDVKNTLIIFSLYGLSCFLVGWLWFRFGWAVAQNEVGNKYNLFVREMRKKIKAKSI